MDHRSFDRLARLLGAASDRRTGLRALVGGLLGAGGLVAIDDDAGAARRGTGKGKAARRTGGGANADRRKRRRTCTPPCAAGFSCVKGTCACGSGVACGGACCGSGQVCRNGACADPLPACLSFGEACKDTGRACCDGLVCASGQGGSFPVTCLRAKGAACAGTEECPYGMTCRGGACLGDACAPAGAPCPGGVTCCPGSACQNGTCRAAGACTVSRSDHASDEAAYEALKAALLAAQDDPGNPARNPVLVGPGVYVFPETLALLSTSAVHAVKVYACDPDDRPVFDGGSVVTTAPNALPAEGDWTGGNGILELSYLGNEDGDCGFYEDVGCAGFEFDGIDFRNAATSNNAGALFAGTLLTLRNARIAHCLGQQAGAVATTTGGTAAAPTTITNVTVEQCLSTSGGASSAGGLYLEASWILENVTVRLNRAPSSAPGGIWISLPQNDASLVLKGATTITGNSPAGITNPGPGKVSCTNGNAITGNALGASAANCTGGVAGDYAGCDCGNTCKVLETVPCVLAANPSDCCIGTCQTVNSTAICCAGTVTGSGCPT